MKKQRTLKALKIELILVMVVLKAAKCFIHLKMQMLFSKPTLKESNLKGTGKPVPTKMVPVNQEVIPSATSNISRKAF